MTTKRTITADLPADPNVPRIAQLTTANAANDARLAPIPQEHRELPAWVSTVGLGLVGVAGALLGAPELGVALPPAALLAAKVGAVVGGTMAATGPALIKRKAKK